MEEIDIVIVGGGISGLSTALALHRKGIRSVVLERSDTLRTAGAGIAILTNGWRALEELGIASKLRQTALALPGVRDVCLDNTKPRQTFTSISTGEVRCLQRSELINALADDLPTGTIRFGCQITSVKLDTLTSYPILLSHEGSTIRAKVLIGCDGANSVVADFLGLKPKKLFASCAVRGYSYYPDGHGFPIEFVRTRKGDILSGRAPVNDKLVFWFVVHKSYPQDRSAAQDPELIREMTLETIKGFPTEIVKMIESCDLSSLWLTHLRYRAPWDVLMGKFRKGTVTVAGDSMHVMGPFLGQGGSAAMEDAVVLARCLARKMDKLDTAETVVVKNIGEAIDEYVKERRTRLVELSTQTYLRGSLLDTSWLPVKLAIILCLVVLFRDPVGHTRYDCGTL